MFFPLPLLAVWLSSHFQRRCHRAAPGCCHPGPGDGTAGCPVGHRLPGRGGAARAGHRWCWVQLGTAMQTRVCTAEPRHQARPALSSGARPKLRFLERVCHWELFHLPRGEGGRGKGHPLSVVQCLPQSRGRQGRGALLHPCVGVVLPAATLTALSASEVPADEPCLEGHIHLSSLHQSVLLGECQG